MGKQILCDQCDQPKIQHKFKTIWEIQANVSKLVSKPYLSEIQNENFALDLEKFAFEFPVQFPDETLTRKMNVFSNLANKKKCKKDMFNTPSKKRKLNFENIL